MESAVDTSLLAAWMLLVAIVGGYIAKWARIPRIVAYILGGVLLRAGLTGHFTAAELKGLVSTLGFVNELALGLILFMLGSVFEAAKLKSTRGAIKNFSVFEMAYTCAFTAGGCFLAAWTLPDVGFAEALTVGLVLGAVAIETAPSATWFVLREYDAKGPTSSHILVLTGLNNMACIILFHLALVACLGLGLIDGFSAKRGAWWVELFMVTAGSAGLGAILGIFLSVVHSRLPLREMILMFFATMFLLAAGDSAMRHVAGTAFNPMVTILVMGAVFANIARDPGFFETTLETVSMPIFALFFVLAGYNLHLEELLHLGVLGVVYIAARTAGKIYGIRRGFREGEGEVKVSENMGLGMLCQAGIGVFLGAYLVRHWPDPLAEQINTVILAAVAVFELAGPLLLKKVAIDAGEVKTVTLLRPGFLRPTWISPAPGLRNLAREYNPEKVKKGTIGKPLTAGDLMRTNVHFLPAASRFEEVLSFIEKSRFHDFPVVSPEGKYLGVLHFQKVRDHIYNPTTDRLVTAVSLADLETPAVTPKTELPRLLELFHKHNLGELPVVEDEVSRHLIGIIEQRDLLRVLHPEA